MRTPSQPRPRAAMLNVQPCSRAEPSHGARADTEAMAGSHLRIGSVGYIADASSALNGREGHEEEVYDVDDSIQSAV